MTKQYHHGDLRSAVLGRAAEVIERDGPGALSMRAIAADLGVSHTAPRYHLGGKNDVLDALALDGFTELGERLDSVRAVTEVDRLVEMGVAYVEFARERPAHFALMFGPEPRDRERPEVMRAAEVSLGILRAQVRRAGLRPTEPSAGASTDDATTEHRAAAGAAAAAWGLVHGLAVLAHSGALQNSALVEPFGGDVRELVRAAVASSRFIAPTPRDGTASSRAPTDRSNT